jgi:hypothetical protein
MKDAISWWGWQEQVCHDETTGTDFVTAKYVKHNGSFFLTFTANEKLQRVGVHVSSPIHVSDNRLKETAIIVNYFNTQSVTGFYYVSQEGDLCFLWNSCVAKGLASGDLFAKLRFAAVHAFETQFNTFLSAAYTNQSATEIIRKREFLHVGTAEPIKTKGHG